MPIKRICRQCKKEFYIKPSVIKKGKGIFCSKDCFYKWFSKNIRGKKHWNYKEKVESKCLWCGKEILTSPSRKKLGRGKFCSKKCMGKYYSQNMIKDGNSRWMGETQKRCKSCGKIMIVPNSKIRKGEGIFCSLQCAGAWKQSHMKKLGTSIENKIEQELIKLDIDYNKQVLISCAATVVDFLLSNKIVIYCDGDYWHRLPKVKQRDERQNSLLKSNGYNVFRFSGTDIKESVENCISKIGL